MFKGRLAQSSCEKYAKKVKSLYESCKKAQELMPKKEIKQIDIVNPFLGLTPDEITLAKSYEKILDKEDAAEKIKEDKAVKIWKIMQAQIKKDAETAISAGKLGMKAPPPTYSKKQIETVKKHLPKAKAILSGIDKANCMRSLNQHTTLTNQAIIAARESQVLPYRQDDAKRYNQEANDVLANYKKMCLIRAV
jgi:hypothetical protein